MSASEKLKALEEQVTPGSWDVKEVQHHWNDYTYALTGDIAFDIPDDVLVAARLRNTLPQLLAVVEADIALIVALDDALVGYVRPRTLDDPGLRAMESALKQGRAALAALDKALS